MLTLIPYIIYIILFLFVLSFLLPVENISDIHGSAMFSKKSIFSPSHTGLVIDGKHQISQNNSFTHSLTIASTGMGKTTRFVLPNVLTLDNASMIISDPKGEVMALTQHDLEARGFVVKTLDFSNPEQSITYNVLERCNSDAEIKQLATSLFDMSNAGTKTEGIWRLGASRLLEIFIHTLKNAPDKRLANMSSLIHLVNHTENGTSVVADFVHRYAPKNIRALFDFFSNSEAKIKMGQLASAASCLANFDTAEIKKLTATDTINFDDFRKKKTVLFLKLPVGVSSRYASVLSLFYTQLFHHLLNTPLAENDLPIYMIMDEFSNLKRLPDFSRVITLIRSKKVSISIVIQAISQLDTVYGKDIAETIIANCSSLIAYAGIREKRTLEYISQMLGTTTKEIHTPGAFGVNFYSRSLMTMDEIRTMPLHKGLFLFGNRHGQKIRPLPIFKNKALMEQAGLMSVNGELVVKPQPLLEEPTVEQALDLPPISIEEELESSTESNEFRERLEELLPK